MYLYTIFLIYNIVMIVFSKNIDIKYGLKVPIPRSVGLRFYAEVMNNAGEDYSVEVHPKQCCLNNNDIKCNIVEIMGSANEIISGGESKTLTMVAPLIDPYLRKGFCTLYVDFRPLSRPKNIKRDIIKIKFNTKIDKSFISDHISPCKHLDEDPLNDCNPVNCDTYYNGKKSYFNKTRKRCVAVPICTSLKSKLLNLAYNPYKNRCVDCTNLVKRDINYIKKISQTKHLRPVKHVTIIKITPEGDDSTIMFDDDESPENQTLTEILTERPPEDLKVVGKKKKIQPNVKVITKCKTTLGASEETEPLIESTGSSKVITMPHEKKKTFTNVITNSIFRYCLCNKYAMMFLIGIIFMQCCLLCTLLYCLTRNCCCFKRKHIINKFFNNKQDVSVTTPLIGTSNIDTDTTDYQYLSESSNYIDKKIKCYKACQKERKNNAKLSMSDDILSKCITRRDWQRLPRSDTIPEINNDDDIHSEELKKGSSSQKKVKDMKVNFQEEFHDKQINNVRSIGIKDSKLKNDGLSDSSEQEIRCHSYNYNNLNITEFKKHPNTRHMGLYHLEKKTATGAQVDFSNDSIDNFLSERAVMFTGDNASRYSFNSISSATKSISSTQSSKTSKNNIVKNVITLISRKNKGPSSDPGRKMNDTELDLKLLHLSGATIYSSSNDTDGEQYRDIKRNKESVTSL